MMNHDVFISYSSVHKDVAYDICNYLEKNGIKCWIAPRNIPVGYDYGDLIEQAIAEAKVFLLIFSLPASLSLWVKGEINTAFSTQKIIMPYRIDDTPLKGGLKVMLNQFHWLDAIGSDSLAKAQLLVDNIQGVLQRKPIVNDPIKLHTTWNAEKKYGFSNAEGEIVIPCQWDHAYDFSEGLAGVRNSSGKHGFIDTRGNCVIPCQYEEIRSFHEGIASVASNFRKWGFVNSRGVCTIPFNWWAAYDFSEGLARVFDASKRVYCYINKSGDVVFALNANISAAHWFKCGLTRVEDRNTRRYGYVDKSGYLRIPFMWGNGGTFSEGYVCVQDVNTGLYGLIDTQGNCIYPCKWKFAGLFHEGLASVKDQSGNWGFINKEGRMTIQCQWKEVQYFSKGLAAVADKNGKWGIIDVDNKLRYPCILERSIHYLDDDTMWAYDNNKWKLVQNIIDTK